MLSYWPRGVGRAWLGPSLLSTAPALGEELLRVLPPNATPELAVGEGGELLGVAALQAVPPTPQALDCARRARALQGRGCAAPSPCARLGVLAARRMFCIAAPLTRRA